MAYTVPSVLIYQRTLSPGIDAITPDLHACIVGPAYDVIRDKVGDFVYVPTPPLPPMAFDPLALALGTLTFSVTETNMEVAICANNVLHPSLYNFLLATDINFDTATVNAPTSAEYIYSFIHPRTVYIDDEDPDDIVALAYIGNDTIFNNWGTYDNMIVTRKQGGQWTPVTVPVNSGNVRFFCNLYVNNHIPCSPVVLRDQNNNRVLVGVTRGNSTHNKQFVYSTDMGANWTNIGPLVEEDDIGFFKISDHQAMMTYKSMPDDIEAIVLSVYDSSAPTTGVTLLEDFAPGGFDPNIISLREHVAGRASRHASLQNGALFSCLMDTSLATPRGVYYTVLPTTLSGTALTVTRVTAGGTSPAAPSSWWQEWCFFPLFHEKDNSNVIHFYGRDANENGPYFDKVDLAGPTVAITRTYAEFQTPDLMANFSNVEHGFNTPNGRIPIEFSPICYGSMVTPEVTSCMAVYRWWTEVSGVFSYEESNTNVDGFFATELGYTPTKIVAAIPKSNVVIDTVFNPGTGMEDPVLGSGMAVLKTYTMYTPTSGSTPWQPLMAAGGVHDIANNFPDGQQGAGGTDKYVTALGYPPSMEAPWRIARHLSASPVTRPPTVTAIYPLNGPATRANFFVVAPSNIMFEVNYDVTQPFRIECPYHGRAGGE